jgi:hypothetical protein
MRGAIDEITFPTGGKVKFTFESHNYSSICKKDVGYAPGFLLSQSGTAGGLRIKKIENIDGVGNVTSKTFAYSNGILEGEPKYSFNYTLGGATMVVTSSSSIYPRVPPGQEDIFHIAISPKRCKMVPTNPMCLAIATTGTMMLVRCIPIRQGQ